MNSNIESSVSKQVVVHNCPLCGGVVYHNADYATEVCIWCVQQARNIDNHPIRIFSSTYWMNGYEVQIEGELTPNDKHECYIHGIPCYITKSPTGTLVVVKQ